MNNLKTASSFPSSGSMLSGAGLAGAKKTSVFQRVANSTTQAVVTASRIEGLVDQLFALPREGSAGMPEGVPTGIINQATENLSDLDDSLSRINIAIAKLEELL